MDDVTIFSGEAHPQLAEEICDYLGMKLSPSTFRRFSNDCQYIQLNANCRESDVFIIQPLIPPVQENLMQLLLMLDAARGASAHRLTAVIPYFGYARSDKKDAPRISIAGRLVADILRTAGADRVLTMTLHSEQVHGFFSVPVDHLNALMILAEHFQQQNLTDHVVVSPDLGNAKAAGHFSKLLGVPVAAGRKQRLSDEKVIIDTVVGEVKGKTCIVMDDEIANGGSMIELLHILRRLGGGPFKIACTHGLFTKQAMPNLTAQPDVIEIVATNTIPMAPEKHHEKVTVLSIGPLVAETIKRIHKGQSVSSLFSEGS